MRLARAHTYPRRIPMGEQFEKHSTHLPSLRPAPMDGLFGIGLFLFGLSLPLSIFALFFFDFGISGIANLGLLNDRLGILLFSSGLTVAASVFIGAGWVRSGVPPAGRALVAFFTPFVLAVGILTFLVSPAINAQKKGLADERTAGGALTGLQPERRDAQKNTCINHLRQIDGAKEQWALETRAASNATPKAADLDRYIPGGTITALACPTGGTVTINALAVDPSCTIPGHALP